MMDTIGGLPAHPLVVHLPVVLIPLALIGVLLMIVRPSLLPKLGVPVTVLAGLGFLGSIVAASSGEELEEQFESAGETISGTLRDHAELGENVQWIAGVFFVLVLAWVLFAAWRRRAGEDHAVAKVRKPRIVHVTLAVLVAVSGVAATYAVYATGHSGAKSVWEEDAG